MKRKTLQRLVRFLMRTLSKSEFLDFENMPKEGGVIVATNHMSHLDTPLLFINPIRPDVTALVTTKYKENAFINWFADTGEGIWINRDIADFSAIRQAAEAIKKGLALGIAPEGTRSLTRELSYGKPGTALLAIKTGAPIVPVGVWGTEDALDKLTRLRKPHMFARCGKPFKLAPIEAGRKRSKIMQKYTDEIMCRIAALLPEKYWGVYREHPKLKEFIKQ